MVIWLYGYGLIYLLSGFMAYELNWFQTLILAGFSYLVSKVCFRSWLSFGVSLSVALCSLGSYVYWHYRHDTLLALLESLEAFIGVYGTSLTVSTVTITLRHQVLVIFLIGLGLMKLLEWLNVSLENAFLYMNVVSAVLVLGGYLGGVMKSIRDYEAFLMLAAILIVNYFYHYYKNEMKGNKPIGPLLTLAFLFAGVILIGSRLLYNFDSNPFERQQPRVVRTAVEREDAILPADTPYGLVSGAPMPVATSFEHEGLLVLTLEGEEVAYLKSSTFENYDNGVWGMHEELYLSKDELGGVQKSKAFEAHDYAAYYQLETVKITLADMVTNALPTAGYQVENTIFPSNVNVYEDVFRGTYYTEQMVEEGYSYEIEAVVPGYGKSSFEGLVKANSEKAFPRALHQLISDDHRTSDRIRSLAAEITEDSLNPYDQAEAIEAYLRNNYTYNEKPAVPPRDADAVEYFLFESREGFCQHFASAQVLLMRSLDIPARYVSGFYVSERDMDEEDFGGYSAELYDGIYNIYDSDAHTWAEAYFPEVGWIMFEATPGRYYKSVSYDPMEANENALESAEENPVTIASKKLLYVLIGILTLVILIVLVLLIIRHRRALNSRSNREKLRTQMAMIFRLLKHNGLIRQSGETVREFSLRADNTFHQADHLHLRPLIHIYEQAIYSPHPISDDMVVSVTAYYIQLGKVMHKRLGLSTRVYFRLLGLVRL